MCENRHLGGGKNQSRLYDPAPIMAAVAHLSIAQAALRLEVDRRQIAYWRSGQKWMMYNTADRLATTIDALPYEFWPDFGLPCCEATTPRDAEGWRQYHRDYRARRAQQRLMERTAS